MEGTTYALLNTYEAKRKLKAFDLEERLKRLSCKRGRYVVSLLEMCRSEAARLMTDKPPMKIRPANDDSNARVSIKGKSFAEAR